MKKVITFLIFSIFATISWSQTQPLEKPSKGYRFQNRIKGPNYKKSRVLEIMIDEYGNYLVATFRGEKASFVYLYVYNLYTWNEKYKIKLDDNRCELYNSTFDESGEFFYVNYDIYRNLFKKINLKTGKIEEVDCSQTPKGCSKIEPQHYKIDGYTIGDNYYIYRDEKFENYLRILVKKEMYIPKNEDENTMGNSGLKNAIDVDPGKGGIIQVTPSEVRDLKAGNEIELSGIPIFFDTNAIDADGNIIPYEPKDDAPFKIRLTQTEINKLEKRISFVYDNFVIKLDIDAWEQEQEN
ncbi:MAG: hypothetical protein PF517_09715 [Salinivirgaceae bacterium]|jgi:hypothetical protein|nr:hypothetical protein [Salinivirgaceae bacterium]